MNKIIYLFLTLVCLNLSIAARADLKPVQPVQRYQLPNGLKIFVKPDHHAPVVVAQIWYKVGSSYEPTGITGISHALEHMMFEGSLHYPDDAHSKIISKNGGNENAVTDYDYTFYYQVLAADKLPIAMQLEADRMQNLSLTNEAFAKEIQVVKEERRMRFDDNPQGLTTERFGATAFISSPYHHTPIGWMKDLNNMTVNDIRQWYQQWYAPNNATLVVVGDVEPEKVYQLAKQYFGAIPAKKLPIVKSNQDQSPLGIRGLKVAVPAQSPWVVLGYNTPSLATTKQPWQAYALFLLGNILVDNHGINGRLNKDLVRGQELATDVDVSYNLYSRLPNIFMISATPNVGYTSPQLEAAILKEVKALQTQLIPEAELQRVKNQLIASKTYSQDDLITQATDIGSLESVGLSLARRQ